MDADMRIARHLKVLLAALLVTVAGPAMAQADSAGRFIVVAGSVQIVGRDGVARIAARDDVIRQGETIVTGANSLAQLRMTDGGAVSVRPETELKLDAYRFSGSDDRDASFFVSIIKGGLRTITGLIGRNRRDNYRITTASATMGIRGTHFEVVHVVQPLPDAAPGTYNRVYEGITTFQNRGGPVVLVSREQTAFVALPGNLAPVLVKPPVAIFGKPTPVPVLTPQSRREGAGQPGADKAAAQGAKEAPGAIERSPAASSPRTLAPATTAPLLSPIDSPATASPALISPARTISPTQSAPLLTTPIDTPTLTAPATTISPTLTAPATTTTSPVLTAPATTTISPTLTAPATTTISPVQTAPATTTISPTLTAPATTTISPVLTAPTTTIQTAPTTTTIIKR